MVLATLSDDTAIRNLIASYAHAADDGDGAGLAALFVADGGLESLGVTVTGRTELAALIHGIYQANLKHLQLNTVVGIDSDTATAVSDLMVQAAIPGTGWQTLAHGRYHDDLVRVGEGWHFSRRVIIWHRATPAEIVDQLRTLMAGDR
ncbi:MAG: nuclear transport factor 2 family protein [Mycobacterium sp.]